jgi:hypothetical protein
MLKDRSDAKTQALARRCDPHRFAGNFNMPAIGLLHPGQYADQGGFSGAVFAEQHMHLTGMEIQRDVVICHNAGKSFGDSVQRYRRRLAGLIIH